MFETLHREQISFVSTEFVPSNKDSHSFDSKTDEVTVTSVESAPSNWSVDSSSAMPRNSKQKNICFSYEKSMPLPFIYVDTSQRLQATSLPFTDSVLNEAIMN